jgi:DNA-directed RNA polymerase subunit omega
LTLSQEAIAAANAQGRNISPGPAEHFSDGGGFYLMARITVEDSLLVAKNRFALVLLTAQREIAAEKVGYLNPDALKGVRAEFKSIPDETEFIGDDEYNE